jgi:hypothetical protein
VVLFLFQWFAAAESVLSLRLHRRAQVLLTPLPDLSGGKCLQGCVEHLVCGFCNHCARRAHEARAPPLSVGVCEAGEFAKDGGHHLTAPQAAFVGGRCGGFGLDNGQELLRYPLAARRAHQRGHPRPQGLGTAGSESWAAPPGCGSRNDLPPRVPVGERGTTVRPPAVGRTEGCSRSWIRPRRARRREVGQDLGAPATQAVHLQIAGCAPVRGRGSARPRRLRPAVFGLRGLLGERLPPRLRRQGGL